MIDLQANEWGEVLNNFDNALRIRNHLVDKGNAIAIPLAVGHSTLFHITFVNLATAIPTGLYYADGSSRGLQINIDRHATYGWPWNHELNHVDIQENWNMRSLMTALDLLPFFNTILTGKDAYKDHEETAKRILDLI